MEEEIFGPVLTLYVYADDKFEETVCWYKTNKLTDPVAPLWYHFSLLAHWIYVCPLVIDRLHSRFAQDRFAIELGVNTLRHSSGNFYINDKCTGAVVGMIITIKSDDWLTIQDNNHLEELVLVELTTKLEVLWICSDGYLPEQSRKILCLLLPGDTLIWVNREFSLNCWFIVLW